MRRRIAFVLSTVLVGTVLAGSQTATASTCTPKQFQACDKAGFMKLAKDLRAKAGYDEQDGFRAQTSPDHVVARFSSERTARAAAARHGTRVLRSIDGGGTARIAVPKGLPQAAFMKALKREPGVIYVEPDFAIRSLGQQTAWGVGAVEAPAAQTNGFTGAGVTVAVVDTGVDYGHEDLDANMWVNAGETPGNRVDDDGNGYVDDVHGYDFQGNFFTATQPDSDPMDEAGHGTHVAGIVAAEDNGTGVVGVAPQATIMAVKVLDNGGGGWASVIAEGMRYAVDNGADILNMSLGAYFHSAAMGDAAKYAADNGVTIVAAAGNSWFYDFPSFPAGYPSVISVAAARESDHTKTWWSDWGTSDFLAPGDQILSTTPDDTYDTYSGTSMASPHVAGALALVLDANPTFSPVQLEQALASTATDTYFTGKDEVSGAGFPDVDAATGVLPSPSTQLHRSKHVISADGTTSSTITVRILNGAGTGVPGITGTFSTDKGSLSAPAFTTNADGEATTVLTADDEHGSATVTATPVGPPAASVRVIIEDDRVQVDEVLVVEKVEEDGSVPGHDTTTVDDEPEPDPEPQPEAGALLPGDDFTVTGFLSRHDFGFTSPRVAFSFEVEDPNGDPVPELSGALEAVAIWGFGGQSSVSSMPMTIPVDAELGEYTITGTATTIAPGPDETHSLTKTFTVGYVDTEVLIVRSGVSFDTETFNFLWPHVDDSAVRRAVDDLGYSNTFWDVAHQGEPSEEELLRHPSVIWLGGWDDDLPTSTLKNYLEAGGNLLLSGELYGTYARLRGNADHRTFMHSVGLLAPFFPDDNHQLYPTNVTGSSGSLFDGITFDIDAYDLNHVGEATSFFSEEVQLNPADGATKLFEYPAGYYAPAVAGVHSETERYRVVSLGFGLESIDDGSSTMQDALDAILSSFSPAPDVTGVLPASVFNNGTGVFEVIGTNFQPAGVTTVKLDAEEIEGHVTSRTSVSATVPEGFPVGKYDVTIVNPDGSSDTIVDAITVRYAPPVITSISPNYASNDRARTVRIGGTGFRPGAVVRLAGKVVPSTFVSGSQVRATVPKGFTPLGLQDVRVTNVDGKSSLRPDSLRVRYGFTFDMRTGTEHPAVTHLQRRLKAYGFFPASQQLTDYFGSITRGALLKYQKSRGLPQTGTLGYATRTKLNSER